MPIDEVIDALISITLFGIGILIIAIIMAFVI